MIPPSLRPAARPGLFRRTPPAVFPSILGLFGLGVSWRRGQGAFGIPDAPIEGFLGAVSLLFLFAFVAYGAKVLRRPGVVGEDLKVLPGRAGLAALTMSVMMLAAVLVPYAPGAALWVLGAGLAAHVALAVAVLAMFLAGPPEARMVTPAMHLVFVGVIVAPLSAVPLGLGALSEVILWYSLAAAAAIWAVGLKPLVTGAAPAPLRPLQAIHLAPAALIGTVAFLTGNPALGTVLAGWAAVLFALLVLRARWLTEAGFSGFWGAFTFPATAFAGVLFLAAGHWTSEPLRLAGGLALVFATLIVPPIGFKVLQLWAKGVLAQKTNAATA